MPLVGWAIIAAWGLVKRTFSSVADAMDPVEDVLEKDAISTGHVGMEARHNRKI